MKSEFDREISEEKVRCSSCLAVLGGLSTFTGDCNFLQSLTKYGRTCVFEWALDRTVCITIVVVVVVDELLLLPLL